MTRKKWVYLFNSLQYVFLVGATVAVLTFQFVSNVYCVLTAIWLYVAGFFVMSARAIFNLVEMAISIKRVKNEESSLVTSTTKEVLNSKAELRHAIFSSIIWTLLFAFSLAILIMYPIA